MEYRQTGDSGLELSAIAYGAFAIGGHMWGGNEKKDSIAAIHASLDHGVSTLDTAPFYGFGQSESLIGEALRGKDRSKIQLLTKFGLVWDGSNAGRGEFFFDAEDDGRKLPVFRYAAPANIVKEVEESLRRLGTDYIDLLQLHWPDATTPPEATMQALQTLIRQGKIRAAGPRWRNSSCGGRHFSPVSPLCWPARAMRSRRRPTQRRWRSRFPRKNCKPSGPRWLQWPPDTSTFK